jgi:hypothetical protein
MVKPFKKKKFIHAFNNDFCTIHGIGTEKDCHKGFTTKSGEGYGKIHPLKLIRSAFQKLILRLCQTIIVYDSPFGKRPSKRA